MNELIYKQAAIDEITEYGSGDATFMSVEELKRWIESLPSVQTEACEDAVSRKAVEEMLKNGFPARGMWEIEGDVVKQTVCETLADALMDLGKLPSVQPDDKLAKIADLVEGTIDHFDLDDAMDLLYQIKDVLDGSDELPSVQPEDCGTCKHGYFGDEQCNSCRVRFTSHYERRNDDDRNG